MNPAEQNMSSIDTEKPAAATGDHDVGVIDTRLQPVESRFGNVENPLTAIEARMEYLATKADLEKIYTLIEKTNTQIQSANKRNAKPDSPLKQHNAEVGHRHFTDGNRPGLHGDVFRTQTVRLTHPHPTLSQRERANSTPNTLPLPPGEGRGEGRAPQIPNPHRFTRKNSPIRTNSCQLRQEMSGWAIYSSNTRTTNREIPDEF